MSIKSAGVLRKLIYIDKKLVITPLLDPDEQMREGSGSVDLRLGTRFITSRKGDLTHIDTTEEGFASKVTGLQDTYYVHIGGRFVLHPGHFVLASTLEYLCLPLNIAGNVVTRSSWGRYGLIIATAVAVHPGFSGVLTLELRNLAEVPLILNPGRRILQVFFHEVEQTSDKFDISSYLGSTKPTVGKFEADKKDIKVIKDILQYRDIPFSL